jgi:hypothetical protein
VPLLVTIIDSLLSNGLRARTGRGADGFTACDSEVRGRVRGNTGRGPDVVVVDDSIFNNELFLVTGGGNDTVRLERDGELGGPRTTFRGRVRLRTRRGSDHIEVGVAGETGKSAEFLACVRVNGGRRIDTLDAGIGSDPNANGNTFTCQPVVRRIEQQLS